VIFVSPQRSHFRFKIGEAALPSPESEEMDPSLLLGAPPLDKFKDGGGPG